MKRTIFAIALSLTAFGADAGQADFDVLRTEGKMTDQVQFMFNLDRVTAIQTSKAIRTNIDQNVLKDGLARGMECKQIGDTFFNGSDAAAFVNSESMKKYAIAAPVADEYFARVANYLEARCHQVKGDQ